MITFTEPAINPVAIPVITHDYSEQDVIDFIFTLEPGQVFYYDENYLTLQDALTLLDNAATTASLTVKVASVLPGTVLYAIHGVNAILFVSSVPKDENTR